MHSKVLFNNITCSNPCAVATFQSVKLSKQSHSCKTNSQHRRKETFSCCYLRHVFCPYKQRAAYQRCHSSAFPSTLLIANTEWIVSTQAVENIAWVVFVVQWLPCWCAQYTTPALWSLIPCEFKTGIELNGCSFPLLHCYKCQGPSTLHMPLTVSQWSFSGKATWNQADKLIRYKKG